MALLIAVALLIVGTTLLVVGADWFLDGASDVARILGISAVVVGVVLAGIEPEEVLTAAVASWRGAPALAVGNVVGTNVTIVTVALGLSALLVPITLDKRVLRQALLAIGVSVIPVVMLLIGIVTQLEGIALLVVFGGYTLFLLRTDRDAITHLASTGSEDDGDEHGGGEQDAADPAKPQRARARFAWKPVGLTVAGLAAMAIGGPAIVDGALRFAAIVGLSQDVVGATIVSLGTGAEMIALGVSAARKKQTDILVGGILGSFAYNLLVTLGVAATIHALPVEPHVTHVALPVMVVAHLILLGFVWYGRIPRLVGALFIAEYAAYLVAMLWL